MPTKRVIIYPYKLGSASAKALAGALGTKCVRANGTYRVRQNDLVVNWGAHGIPNWWGQFALARTLNRPQYVENCSDKIKTFDVLSASNIPCVPFTADRNVARAWLREHVAGGRLNAVVCRTLTRANSGRGIVLAKTEQELVAAPLYTRYVPKEKEFRVHIFRNGGVIDVQEKRRTKEFVDEGHNKYIRNHPNGWVFCRDNVTVPDGVRNACEQAILALQLDFGAVDIGYHRDLGVAIYEVNTAPGIEGQTLTNYANKFRSLASNS